MGLQKDALQKTAPLNLFIHISEIVSHSKIEVFEQNFSWCAELTSDILPIINYCYKRVQHFRVHCLFTGQELSVNTTRRVKYNRLTTNYKYKH